MATKRKNKNKGEDDTAMQAVEDALNVALDEVDLAAEIDVDEAKPVTDQATDDIELDDADIDLDMLEEKLASVANDLRAEDVKSADDSQSSTKDTDVTSANVAASVDTNLSSPDKPSPGNFSVDDQVSKSGEIPVELTGTTDPVYAANDDTKDSFSDLLYALQKKPKSSANWIAIAIGLVWVAACGYYAFTELGPKFSAISSIKDLANAPEILIFAAVSVVPLILLWSFSTMIRRAHEMRVAAHSMTEAAVRLLQPETIASDSFNTLGRAIRREVTAIGDGVERALARAGELEHMVQSEVNSLERSYTDSEIKLRGLVGELSGERETIETHAEKLRDSISDTHQGLSDELSSATLRIQDAVIQASHQVTDVLEDRGSVITVSLLEAGDNLAARMSVVGDEAQARLTATGKTLGDGIAVKTNEMTENIQIAGQAMASLLDARAIKFTEQSNDIAHRFEENVIQRSTEFAERINIAGETLNTALDSRISAIRSTLSSQGTTLVEALGMRTETLDKILGEHSATINSTIDHGVLSIVDGLADKSSALDKALVDRTQQITGSLNESVGKLVSGLGTKTELLDKVLDIRSGQIDTVMETRVSTLVENLDTRTQKLDKSLEEKSFHFDTTLKVRVDDLVGGMEQKTHDLDQTLTKKSGEMVSTMGKSIGHLIEGLDQSSQSLDKTMADRTNSIGETISGRLTGFGQTLTGQVDQAVTKLTVKTKELQETTTRIEFTIDERTNSLSNTLQSRTKELADTFGNSEVKITTAIAEGHKKVTDDLAQLASDTAASLDQKTETISKLLADRAASINENMGSKLTETQRVIEANATSLEDMLESKTQNLSGMITDKSKKINSELSERTDELASIIDDKAVPMVETMHQRTRELSDTFNSSEMMIAKVITDGHTKITQDIDDKITETTANLDEKAKMLSQVLGERATSINESMGSKLVETQKTIENSSHDLADILDDRTQKISGMLSERSKTINDDLVARADEMASIIDDRALPMVESMRIVGEEVANRLTETSSIVDVTVSEVINKLGSSNDILRTLVDQTGENLGTIQASLAHQSASLMSSFDKATNDLEMSRKLAHEVQMGMEKTASDLFANVDSVAGRLDEQGNILMDATRLIDASQTNFATTLDARQEMLKELSVGLVQRSDEIEGTMSKLSMAVTQMLTDANDRSKELGGIVSSEVSMAINDATTRFSNATDSMKIAARDVAAELEQTREQMRRGVLELPDETRQSADSMRRVVTDQIQALKDLSEIVTRSGKALDATPAARKSRSIANTVSAAPVQTAPALDTSVQPAAPVMPPQRPTDAQNTAPAQSYVAQPARQVPPTPPANRAQPHQSAAPATPTKNSGEKGWVSDLLRRASSDEPIAAPAPPQNAKGPNRTPQNVVESLNALSMDIARAIDHEASVELWDRYQRGERNVFTRRLYTIQGQQTFDEIQRKYQSEPEFKSAVTRYVEDFERLLADIARNDRDNVMTQTYLTSDTGKVYTMLAHAAGRLS